MPLHNKYRFFLDLPTGRIQAYPANNSLLYVEKKEKGKCYLRRTLDTELCFVNDASRGITDFNELFRLDNSPDRCAPVVIDIEVLCEGQWQPDWSGIVCMDEIEFDCNLCTAKIQPEPNDDYRCFDLNKKTEFNIFSCPRTAIKTFIGEIECITIDCTLEDGAGNPDPCAPGTDPPDATNTWSLTSRILFYDDINIGGVIRVVSRWCREVESAVFSPEGPGWINIGFELWARRVPLVNLVNNNFDNQLGFSYTVPFENETDIDNGVRLTELLQKCADACNLSLSSDFFGVNPTNDAPNNFPYQCASDHLQDVIVFDKFDIETINAQNNSTDGPLTCEKLLEEILPILYNVCFVIENGVLKVEHLSYFEAQTNPSVVLDLTVEKYAKCMLTKNIYSYDTSEKPNKESWQYGESVQAAFKDTGYVYEGLSCLPGDDQEYTATCINSDVATVYDSSSDPGDDIFVFISTINYQGSLHIEQDTVIGGPNTAHWNGHHAWDNLTHCYHRNGRPFNAGTKDGDTVNFFSWVQYKFQNDIQIPFSCAEYASLDRKGLVKTKIGDAEITYIGYDTETCTLTLNLSHETPVCI